MPIWRFFRRSAEQSQLAEEIESYIAHEIDDNISRGMSRDEARRQAHLKFGNPQRVLEEVWQWNTIGLLDNLARDFLHALRTLSRERGFTLVAVVVIAIGIGANTAIFSVVRSVLLEPLPFADPAHLVRLYEQSADGRHPYNVVAGGIFQEWQRQSRSFEQMAILGGSEYNLSATNGQLPEKVEGGKCSWNLFSTLGVQPAYGRVFTALDDRPDASATVVLTWNLWKRRFGGDPAIVGKDILLDGAAWTVIGVLPSWFSYPDPETQVWTPIRHETRPSVMESLNNHQFRVIARLRSDRAVSDGLTDVDTISKRIRSEHPALRETIGRGANTRALLDEIVGDYKTPLYVLLAATACFLLIAVLNVANLMVARSAARRREFAIRTALGGSRWRLFCEQISESMLLSIVGGAFGIGIAWAAVHWLIRVRHDIPRAETIQIDVLVLLFAAGITFTSGILSGLVPYLGRSGTQILQTLQESSRSHCGSQNRARLHKLLLSLEVGLTAVLLIAAGLLLKSYERLRSSDLGCGTENILTMRISLPKPKYNTVEKRTTFFERVVAEAQAIPGVVKAGMISFVPGRGYGSDDSFSIVEHPPLPPGKVLLAIKRFADPNYFAAMQIPFLRGRSFKESERLDHATAVIISDLFARKFLAGEDPIGKHLRVNLTDHEITYEIVGVVGDTRFMISRPVEPMMYFPLYSGFFGSPTIVVRSQPDPNSLAIPVQKLIAQMDSDLPVSDVLTMEQLIGGETMSAGFTATLVLGFAMLSLLLAAVGLYGVLSYLVTQRTNEIGIRVALGAQRAEVLRLMLFDGMRPAALGLIAGLATAVAATRLIRDLLYGVKPLDASTFVLVASLLCVTAAVACIQPAWRASRLDPMEALRSE